MAPRPAWKGYLKLSLVTCAVELTNATTQAEKVSFRMLNRATGHALKRQYIDAESGKPVEEDDEVKGYEVGRDEFLLIEEENLDAVQIESSHTLSLDGFVRKADVDQIYLDQPYYLTPADEVSAEAFAVIRDALADKKMCGLARIVLYRRERPALIEAFGKGMLLTTLHYENTVRVPKEIFGDIGKDKLDDETVELAIGIIDGKTGKFDPSKFEDRYEDALLDLIKAKKGGRKPRAAKAASREQPSNVVNLFDALKKSLDNGKAGSKAKAAPAAKSKASGKPAAKAGKSRSSS